MRVDCLRGLHGCWWKSSWGWRSFGPGFYLFVGIYGSKGDAWECRNGILRSIVHRCWRWDLFVRENDALFLDWENAPLCWSPTVSYRHNPHRTSCDSDPTTRSTSFSSTELPTWVRACTKRSNSSPFDIGRIFTPWLRSYLQNILG